MSSQNLFYLLSHIIPFRLCIVCVRLPIQGECDRLTHRVQSLESELIESTAHCVELERQRDEEAEKCQLMEVCTSEVF